MTTPQTMGYDISADYVDSTTTYEPRSTIIDSDFIGGHSKYTMGNWVERFLVFMILNFISTTTTTTKCKRKMKQKSILGVRMMLHLSVVFTQRTRFLFFDFFDSFSSELSLATIFCTDNRNLIGFLVLLISILCFHSIYCNLHTLRTPL